MLSLLIALAFLSVLEAIIQESDAQSTEATVGSEELAKYRQMVWYNASIAVGVSDMLIVTLRKRVLGESHEWA
jgi:hypothetical protein